MMLLSEGAAITHEPDTFLDPFVVQFHEAPALVLTMVPDTSD